MTKSIVLTELAPTDKSLNLTSLAVGGKFNVAGNLLINANLLFNYRQVMWEPNSAWRATNSVGCPTTGASAAPVGCLYGSNSNNFNVNLLDTGDLYGERISLADVKFAKNFRFSGKRLNVGVDIFNVTNSDAVVAYNGTYTIDNPATPAVEQNLWMTPTTLLAPRFARLTVQFDF